MLIGLTELKTYQVASTDGEVGRVVDIVFPQGQWSVRYLVAWSDELGREIALPSSGVLHIRPDDRLVQVDAEKDRVEASPELEMSRRIERQEEEQLYEHYGWPPYWLAEENDVTPIGILSEEVESIEPIDERESANPELQLAGELVGSYAVHALEAQFGVLQDVVIDNQTWMIPYVAVDAPLLVETGCIGRVDWVAKEIHVSLPAAVLLDGPAYRSAEPLTPELERSLHEYYERIGKTV